MQQRAEGDFGRQADIGKQRQVNAPVQQLLKQIAGQFFIEVQADMRISRRHRTQQWQSQRAGDALRQGHHHRTAEGLRRVKDRHAGVLQMLENALGVLVEDFARIRRADAVAAAVQQLHPEFFFEFQDLFTQGRLGHKDFAGSPREAAAVNNRHKIFELSNFHAGDSTALEAPRRQPKILPGFIKPLGSSACLIERMTSTAFWPCSTAM